MLRVLTFNAAGIPPDIAPIVGTPDGTYQPKWCDPNYHYQMAQERRFRVFVERLGRMTITKRPHVLCFQEMMWGPVLQLAHQALTESGYTSLPLVSFIPQQSTASKEQDTKSASDVVGSGLAIYIDAKQGCSMSFPWFEVFENRIGYDTLSNKGIMGCVMHMKKYRFEIITTHPQAYSAYDPSPAPRPSEQKENLSSPMSTYAFRRGVAQSMDAQGGGVAAVRAVHLKQLAQIRRAMDREIQRHNNNNINGLDACIVAADMNINRYDWVPGSAGERDPQTAYTGTKTSAEFRDMLRLLDVHAAPPAEERKGDTSGLFTWNPDTNTVIVPQPTQQVYQWIDYVMVRGLNSKRVSEKSLTNRVVAFRTQRIAFPELGAFWQPACVQTRKDYIQTQKDTKQSKEDATLSAMSWSYEQVNADYQKRFVRGCQQVRTLLRSFCNYYTTRKNVSKILLNAILDAMNKDNTCDEESGIVMWVPSPQHPLYGLWSQWVQMANSDTFDQVWKGLDTYGFKPTDKNVTESYFDPQGRPLGVGMPHGYRMMVDASDHQGVLGTLKLR